MYTYIFIYTYVLSYSYIYLWVWHDSSFIFVLGSVSMHFGNMPQKQKMNGSCHTHRWVMSHVKHSCVHLCIFTINICLWVWHDSSVFFFPLQRVFLHFANKTPLCVTWLSSMSVTWPIDVFFFSGSVFTRIGCISEIYEEPTRFDDGRYIVENRGITPFRIVDIVQVCVCIFFFQSRSYAVWW